MTVPGLYLLDTNTLSELKKTRPNAEVVRFIRDTPTSSLYTSALTLGELRRGAAIKRQQDPLGAEHLTDWIDSLEQSFKGRVLSVDTAVARVWGEISADRTRQAIDTLLAATAIGHGLTVVTRNVKDFRGLPVKVLNPWVPL